MCIQGGGLGRSGSERIDGHRCDLFYFHGIGAYAFGAMGESDGTAVRFHSPNQVQVEYE